MGKMLDKFTDDEFTSLKRLKKVSARNFIVLAISAILIGLGIFFNLPVLIWIGAIPAGIILLGNLFIKVIINGVMGLNLTTVVGTSMQPFLQDKQNIGTSRIKHPAVKDFEINDVVVISTKKYRKEFPGVKDSPYIIKRLILAGEGIVKCENGSVFIKRPNRNWQLYGKTAFNDTNFGPYILKEDDIFVLGDNFYSSIDSRFKEGKSKINRLYKISDIYSVYAGKSLGDAIMNVTSGIKPKMYKDSQELK